ncbi:hypothetical protein F5H01DRAFT_330019, partial [Linnemannia elongata]
MSTTTGRQDRHGHSAVTDSALFSSLLPTYSTFTTATSFFTYSLTPLVLWYGSMCSFSLNKSMVSYVYWILFRLRHRL